MSKSRFYINVNIRHRMRIHADKSLTHPERVENNKQSNISQRNHVNENQSLEATTTQCIKMFIKQIAWAYHMIIGNHNSATLKASNNKISMKPCLYLSI